MARAPKAMDLQKDVNSFKDIAKETRLLIRELKQFGETGTKYVCRHLVIAIYTQFLNNFNRFSQFTS